jgi:hypothetical protein
MTLRIVGLWKERGFGWWLLGGLWAAAYNLLLLPTTMVKNIMIFNREQALPTSMTGSAFSKTDTGVLPLQGGAGSGPEVTRTPDEDAEASSPYSSANRQLKQARKMLAAKAREAAEKLERVHTHYEKKLQQASTSTDRPSAPDA